jgi:hypothetical protein
MYYKLYRRRQYIYLAAICIGILLMISMLSKPTVTDDDRLMMMNRRDNDGGGGQQQQQELLRNERIERINMNNYVEPEQCKGCPGENGQAVSLTVRKYFFLGIV